jgi:DNA-binding response OmpR family regulator/Flp pilus assembly protein TadD
MEPRTPHSEPPRKTVLVVDSDAQSLRIVDVSLRRAGFDVQSATDGIVAASLIARVPPPDLVISDLDLPGLDGFELCRRAKATQGKASIPFIFLARPSTTNKVRAFELGADDFLSKPVLVKEIVTRTSALLQRHERERMSSGESVNDRVAGSLGDLSTIDLLQTIATNGKSGVLHLRSSSGTSGEVYFRRGAVVDAEVGRLSGSDAVYRLLSWTEGRFEIEWRNIRRRDTVALSAPALLMEGMRRLDEWTRLTQQLPPLETIFEVDYRLLAERLADIPDEVNGILRLFDGVRTAMQVIDDCGLSDLDALTIIGKLNSEELIRNVTGQPGDAGDSGPDLEGWLSESPEGGASARSRPDTSGAEARSRRASDAATAHRHDPPPGAVAERPAPAKPLRDRGSEYRDLERAPAPTGLSESRPEEPAVVIPFPTATPSPLRQSMGSPLGAPAAAVAGEISNGISTSASGAAPAPTAPASPSSTGPHVSIPRSTDPGIGPGISLPVAPAPVVPPAPVVAAPVVPPVAPPEPPHHAPPAAGRRDSSPKVPELPFSDSASRWMTEGDEIHTGRSKAAALDELALPSRFRGLAIIAAIVVVASTLLVLTIRHFRGERPAEMVAVTMPAPLTVVPNPSPPPSPPPAVPLPADDLAAPPPDRIPTAAVNTNPGAGATKPAAAAAAPANPVPGDEPAAGSSDFPQLLATCQSAFNAGRMKEASTTCTAAVGANPESAKAISLLAHAEFNRSHLKDALSWAEKAIKIDPKTADAYVIIGGVQQDAGHTAAAKSAYRKYLELAPKGQYAPDLRAIVDSL